MWKSKLRSRQILKSWQKKYPGETTGCRRFIIFQRKRKLKKISKSLWSGVTTSILSGSTLIIKNRTYSIIAPMFGFWLFFVFRETTQQYEKPICRCCVHLGFSRTRIGQLNDQKRNDQYIRALKKRVTNDSTVVCISDGSLLGLTALKLGAKKVVILETNYLSRRTIESFVPSELAKKVDVIDAIDKLPPSEQVDLVFAEPYFVTSILPWDNLRFWYILSNYSTKVSRMPISCTVNAVAVEFKDLHKIRAPLGICEGFDMKIFDRLLEVQNHMSITVTNFENLMKFCIWQQDSSRRSDSSVEAQPLWEYPCRALSPPFEIMTFDFTQDVNSQQNATVSSSVNFVEWVERSYFFSFERYWNWIPLYSAELDCAMAWRYGSIGNWTRQPPFRLVPRKKSHLARKFPGIDTRDKACIYWKTYGAWKMATNSTGLSISYQRMENCNSLSAPSNPWLRLIDVSHPQGNIDAIIL